MSKQSGRLKMKKSEIEVNETPGHTPELKAELALQIAELAPEAFLDGKLDLEKFRELLGEDITEDRERFGLFWPGKKKALRSAQDPTAATLRPNFTLSKSWETTKNIFIEGDNLEVLKILQRNYHGKIKMIYIDPPYNTGKDFIYPDNFKEGLENYLEWTKQVNEQGKKLTTNGETEGRYHSNWLNMMYPRLKLARNLLTEDGIIFISIDDHEVAHLRKLGDEIFGEDNFAGQLIWKKGGTGKNDSQFAVVEHEYVLAYARRAAAAGFGVDPEGTVTTSYNREDEKGRYSLVRLDSKTLGYVPTLDFEISDPTGKKYVPEQPEGKKQVARWRWGKEKVKNEYELLVFENGFVYTKNYESAGARPRSLMTDERFGVTRTGKAEAEAALGQTGVFDFPKPVRLIQHLIRITTGENDLVLDFFAGSGTTAQAVMDQNAIDGGTRNFMLVQLPEPTPEDSEARSLGYATISEISRARIIGAGLKLESQISVNSLDTGFRSYSLSDTNFVQWRITSEIETKALEQHILDLRESASDVASPEALLVEILLKQGYSLTEEIGKIKVLDLELMSVGNNVVFAYLDESKKPTILQLRAALDLNPAKFIILEDVLNGDDEFKTNLTQECKSRKIELWTA
jgi:adenine-specific DNA-methyltransferase